MGDLKWSLPYRSKLDASDKEILQQAVKMAQKCQFAGSEGSWKEYIQVSEGIVRPGSIVRGLATPAWCVYEACQVLRVVAGQW